MKKVEKVNLEELVQEVAQDLLTEKKRSVGGLVKQLLQKAEQLSEDVEKGKSELTQKEVKLKETLAKIEKLKSGDWSVLTDQAKKFEGSGVEE